MIGLDLSGAGLSGRMLQESWFTDARLAGAKLVEADLYRSHAVVRENTFKVTVDETTNFTGMSGTLFGLYS